MDTSDIFYMVKVSILIPVYNVRTYILKCLNSVITQTYRGSIECILVDDCGNDDSCMLAESFIANFQGNVIFRIIHHKYNRGLAAARNTAVKAATGDFIFHLDSDDSIEPECIELLANKQQETNADIVSGAAICHKKEGKIILEEPNYETPNDMIHKTIEMTLDHVIWRRLIRKTLYTDNRIEAFEGVNVGEDHHTLPRLVYYAKKITKINDVIYNYNCMNPNSYMSIQKSNFNIKRFYNDISSIEILYDFFLDKDDYCTTRLKEIRKEYIKKSLLNCCILSDKMSYMHICNDFKINKSYYMFKTKNILHILRLKIFKIGEILMR